jgi:hypothetical protein
MMMKLTFTFISFCMTLITLLPCVHGYAYGPVVNVSEYSRTYYCERAAGMITGLYNVSTALSGMVVSTAVNYDTDPVYFVINNTTGTVTGGLMYEIQQAVAAIGNFTFEYHMVADASGKSSNSYMLSTLSRFDMLGVYYTDTVARRSKGIGFSQVWAIKESYMRLHLI